MSTPEFEIKFHFGTKRIKQRNVYITALFLNLAVSLLVRFLKVKPEQLWIIIDELGRKFRIKLINSVVLQSPELLDRRISRDVDKAINDYKDVVEWKEPKVRSTFSELEEGETPLGGEMRRRDNWVDN